MMKIFFATDFHGSEICFERFLSAKKKYDADVLVLGGDVTGRGVTPIVRTNGVYECMIGTQFHRCESNAELRNLQYWAHQRGIYTIVVCHDEYERLKYDQEFYENIERRLIIERMDRWLAVASDQLGKECKIYFCPGNDDPIEYDYLFQAADVCVWIEQMCVALGNGLCICGIGGSNFTPWNSPREFSEEVLHERLTTLCDKLEPSRSIWSIHVPPWQSGLDSSTYCPTTEGKMAGCVGSTAVREFIEIHQPMLGLFGHVHEADGIAAIGRTTCINPGSIYQTGKLSGALMFISNNGVEKVAFTLD